MIVVKRIAGESYDLETGAAIPKSLVLSNGSQELSILIDDDTAAAVIQFMAAGGTIRAPGQVCFSGPAPHQPTMTLVPPTTNPEEEFTEWDDPESGLKSL